MGFEGNCQATAMGIMPHYLSIIADNTDIAVERIAEQALIAPARCCLKNSWQVGASGEQATKEERNKNLLQPEERLVETAFEYLKVMSGILRKEFSLYERS